MPDILNGTAYSLSGPENGSVVTLIHGLGMNRLLWKPFETALTNHHRVLSYDILGHGESTRPDDPLSLQWFSDQLQDLLDELDIERCAVVGFSLGGMINRRFAMGHPERTSALVILNSPHERTAEAQQLVEERVRDTAMGGPGATIDTSMKRWFTPQFLATDDPIIHKVQAWILENDPKTYPEARQVLAREVARAARPRHAHLAVARPDDGRRRHVVLGAVDEGLMRRCVWRLVGGSFRTRKRGRRTPPRLKSSGPCRSAGSRSRPPARARVRHVFL